MVSDIVESLLLETLGHRANRAQISELAAVFLSHWGPVRLPQPRESACIAANPKTAALCYDRVWAPACGVVPESVRFAGDSPFEVRGFLCLVLLQALDTISGTSDDAKADLHVVHRQILRLMSQLGEIRRNFGDTYQRAISSSLAAAYGLKAVPIYDSATYCDRDFCPGDYSTVIATLSNLAIVSESELTWAQVAEFRSDTLARTKYRRLIHWLDAELAGKPSSFVEDALAAKLDDYSWSLRKHGIATVFGVVSSILDLKTVSAASAASAGASVVAGPSWGLAAGLSVMVGNLAVRVSQALLDVKNARRGEHSEIAFIYEARKTLGG